MRVPTNRRAGLQDLDEQAGEDLGAVEAAGGGERLAFESLI